MLRATRRPVRQAVAAVVAVCVLGGILAATTTPVVADGNEAPGAAAAFRAISAGTYHTCAVLDDATVKCWGYNAFGQLGYGDTTNRGDGTGGMGDDLPAVDLGTGRTATAITAGFFHTCALLDNGDVKCWGDNGGGRLGYGDAIAHGTGPGEMGDDLPAVDLGTGRTATAITAGGSHTCALLDNGTVKCWGAGASGQLGQGNTSTRGDGPGEMGDSLPAVDLGAGRTATAVTAGDQHSCVLLDDATVKCWGGGGNGQLGLGDSANRGDGPGEMGDALPAVDLGAGRTATAATAGGNHTCALLDDATVKCWGYALEGQLGYEDDVDRGSGPGQMGDALPAIDLGTGRTAVAVSADTLHTCALLDDATVKCWGRNNSGQLGYGDIANRGSAPGQMGDDLPAVDLGTGRSSTAVTAGDQHTCAVLDDATLKCWGTSGGGQLGYGDLSARGDDAGEMGDALPVVALGTDRRVTPVPPFARVRVTVGASPAAVVVGQDIDYVITVTNSGSLPLTDINLLTPDVPACADPVPDLGPGASSVVNCSYETTASDVPVMTNQALVTTDQGVFGLSGTRRTRVDPVVFRPDAQIRLGAGAFAGDGTYNTSGAGQSRAATVANLGTATFTLRIQNDGNTVEAFTVKGLGSTSRSTVTYRNGFTNITTQVVAGTFTTDPLTPGVTQDLTLTIKAKAGTPVGNALSRTVTVTSHTEPTAKDAVKATVTRR